MRLLLLFFPVLFLACQSSGKESQGTSFVDGLLAPNTDTLSYPVYDSFADIAPLFEQQDGKTYVINFWATWCKPCVEEMPYFEQLAQAADEDLVVVAVSLDFKKDIGTKLKRYVDTNPDLPPVLALADDKYNNWIDQVDPDWGGAIPVTVIYRDDERVFHSGSYESYATLKTSVDAVR